MTKPTNDSTKYQRRERVLAGALGGLLLATLLSSHAVSGVLARYTTAASATDTARVALFGHDEKIDLGDWAADLTPGTTKTITLSVSNSGSNGISEVAEAYSIQIETAGNLPLTYTLANKTGDTVGTFTESAAEPAHTFQTADMQFPAGGGTAYAHDYTLTVSWPADAKASRLADIPDYVQANINVTQID